MMLTHLLQRYCVIDLPKCQLLSCISSGAFSNVLNVMVLMFPPPEFPNDLTWCLTLISCPYKIATSYWIQRFINTWIHSWRVYNNKFCWREKIKFILKNFFNSSFFKPTVWIKTVSIRSNCIILLNNQGNDAKELWYRRS